MRKRNQNGLQTVFHYGPNGELLWEKDQAGNTKAYVWLEGRPLARIDNNAQIYYYHVDHLGTPQAMTNSTGAVVWKADYEPFGKTTVKVSTVENNLRFPGQYYDRETGLHYNYFRDYEPGTGRYVQADPIGLEGGLNVYAYGANDPISQIDPLGLANGPAISALGPPKLRPSPNGKVQLCCRPADIVNGWVDHCWLKTSTITAGMNETAQCTLAGNDASGFPFTPVVVSDHSCDMPERCERYDVDEQCVNRELSVGRHLGLFSPVNNCQTFARDVLLKCRKK